MVHGSRFWAVNLFNVGTMTHASVFSGIGGPEVAATMLGWENLFHCEINPFGRKVLDYWYPKSKSYEDITTTDFTEWRGRVDVLTGGFPCQPFSYAGRRRGAEDDRYLWPSMYRAIDEIQPTWVVAENVAGILTMVEQGEVSKVAGTASLFDAFDDLRGRFELRETFTLQRICTDLEGHGYAVQPVLVPACAVGAPHRRDRVFIVARRVTSDGSIDRLEHAFDSRAESELREAIRGQGSGAELHVPTATDGSGRTTADTSEPRAESLRRERQDAVHRPRPSADTSCECGERLRPEQSETRGTSQEQSGRRGGEDGHDQSFADYYRKRLERWYDCEEGRPGQAEDRPVGFVNQDNGIAGNSRWLTFPSVSPVHRGNDGLPFDVDRLTLSFGKWRTEALKAYGNAIVPQVMYEIFRAIQQVENVW